MIIEGLDIFLTWKQYKQLLTENVQSELNKLPSANPENIDKILKEKNIILHNEIKRKFSNPKENGGEFLNSWLKFDLIDDEAKDNTWNLLNDFCRRNSYTFLQDNRSLEKKLKSDYLGETYSYYPMGKKFFLVYLIPEKNNFYGKRLQASTEVEIMIDTSKVTRIEGEYKLEFTIHTSECKYIFGRGLSVLPAIK